MSQKQNISGEGVEGERLNNNQNLLNIIKHRAHRHDGAGEANRAAGGAQCYNILHSRGPSRHLQLRR